MKNDPIESALAQLDTIPLHASEAKAGLAKALTHRSNLIVAKAARLAGNATWHDLAEDLERAFNRIMDKGPAADKTCAATIAIARALVQHDRDAPALYLRGMHHIQMEASFGPPVDAATELRAVCAMGLANSAYPHKLRDLLPLMGDKERQVRAGAIRAIAVVGNDSASLLLRFKLIAGDRDPEVMSDCFIAVLALEGAEGIPLVTTFAVSANPELREAAILALGASRRIDAIEWLIAQFDRTPEPSVRKYILLALSTSRVDTATEFLLQLIRNSSDNTARLASEALSIHSRDAQLTSQVEAALAARSKGIL